MKRKRWVLICAMVIAALILGGCFNIKQEYWLNPDGSAKVGMDIGLSEALLSMGGSSGSTTSSPFDDLRKKYNTPNAKIKNVQIKEYKEGDLQHFSVTFETANFEDFLKSQSTSDKEFNVALTKAANGNILFNQITQLDESVTSSTTDMDPKTMGPAFKDMYWTVIVHVPAVVNTNGTKVDGSTVQWKIPMADVFAGKAPSALTLEYSTKAGGFSLGGGDLGWVVWVILGLVALALGGGAAYYFLVLRKRRAKITATPSYQPGGYRPPQTGPYAGYPPPPGGQPVYPVQQGFPGQSLPPGSQPGYPPPGSQPGYPPPGSQPGYPPPGSQPGYPPPGSQPGYPPPGSRPGYPPPGSQPGYPPPGSRPGYPSPGNQPGYPPPGNQTGYPPPANQPGYPPPGNQPGYPPPGSQSGYPPPGGQPGYPVPQHPPQPGIPPQIGQPGNPAPQQGSPAVQGFPPLQVSQPGSPMPQVPPQPPPPPVYPQYPQGPQFPQYPPQGGYSAGQGYPRTPEGYPQYPGYPSQPQGPGQAQPGGPEKQEGPEQQNGATPPKTLPPADPAQK